MISDEEISTVEKNCLNESDCEIIGSSNDEIVNTSQDDHEPSLDENESIEIINESSSNDDEDDEDDDSNQLSGAECLIRCKEFASITGTDNALAMFYLQNTKWNLEESINEYFQQTQPTGSKVVACFDVKKLNKEEKRKSNEPIFPTSPKKSKHDDLETNNSVSNKDEIKYFKVLSWNIDGLDEASFEARISGVVLKILSQTPDIVLLQEVIILSENILREKLKNHYSFFSGNMYDSSNKDPKNYYTMVLTKKATCKNLGATLINFPNSVMARNILKVHLNYADKVDICVLNTHLESTVEYAKQRIEQLRKCFKEITDQEKTSLVIFGGDLNLRDKELESIGGLPNGVHDLWQSTGSRKEATFTWDTMRNTNLKWAGKFKPRCRFDRLYYRANSEASKQLAENSQNFTLMPVYFELEGLEKLKSCGRFCSDHWAIQSYCQLQINS